MPLQGFTSLCDKKAAIIVSRDKGKPYHKAINTAKANVAHYKIDGVVIKTGNKCDYLLMNEDTLKAYLIELKGSDLVQAARQLESTQKALQHELSNYTCYYRIVANKCKTQAIHSSAYRAYEIRWKERLKKGTGCIEEEI